MCNTSHQRYKGNIVSCYSTYDYKEETATPRPRSLLPSPFQSLVLPPALPQLFPLGAVKSCSNLLSVFFGKSELQMKHFEGGRQKTGGLGMEESRGFGNQWEALSTSFVSQESRSGCYSLERQTPQTYPTSTISPWQKQLALKSTSSSVGRWSSLRRFGGGRNVDRSNWRSCCG